MEEDPLKQPTAKKAKNMKQLRKEALLGTNNKVKGGMLKTEQNEWDKEDGKLVKLEKEERQKEEEKKRNELFALASVRRAAGRYLVVSHPMHYINYNYYDCSEFDIL